MTYAQAEMVSAATRAMRPPERLSPSAWSAKYRHVKPGTSERPGRWSNDVFPYLTSIMDSVEEALRLGKRGLVLMKSGQGGGSEAMVNVVAWLRDRFSGPILYLISKDELAKEFGRERFGYLNETCDPLKAKVLPGRDSLQRKRYTTGQLVIQGGKSVLNLQSTPYRFVVIDEVDSLLDEIEGHGDPIKLAEIRTDSFTGQTLIIAFAHPSTKGRGAGKLYYELSDMRRGHVSCPHCRALFWLTWDHVKVAPDKVRDPSAYRYETPCCGHVLTDAERFSACREVAQLSTLSADEAARRPWIGVHFSQLYMSNKPLAFLAEKWIEGIDDDAARRVWINKRAGDVYEPKVRETRPEEWSRCVVVPRGPDDREAYTRGYVPPGVRFLTAGQDSRTIELHWAVWGWGLVRNKDGFPELAGWLIDYGCVKRDHTPTIEAADLAICDQLLYSRSFPRTDGTGSLYVTQGYHDSGWCPVAVYEYCRRRPGQSIPAKGDSDDDGESSAPVVRWGAAPTWRGPDGRDVQDSSMRLAILNTYILKTQLFGMLPRRIEREGGIVQTQITLPRDVGDEWIEHACSEVLVQHKRKTVFRARGPNHWSDCNIYAYAAALQLNPFQRGQTRDEAVEEAKAGAERIQRQRIATGGAVRRIGAVRRSY